MLLGLFSLIVPKAMAAGTVIGRASAKMVIYHSKVSFVNEEYRFEHTKVCDKAFDIQVWEGYPEGSSPTQNVTCDSVFQGKPATVTANASLHYVRNTEGPIPGGAVKTLSAFSYISAQSESGNANFVLAPMFSLSGTRDLNQKSFIATMAVLQYVTCQANDGSKVSYSSNAKAEGRNCTVVNPEAFQVSFEVTEQ
jgi:hypothetical protein